MAFRFEHLEIWKDSLQYTSKVYSLTKKFPRQEVFSLTDQLRRAASSIPTNIAEGAGSNSKKDFSHYLDIAIKSLYETVSLLFVAQEQEYIVKQERESLYTEAEILVKKISAFRKYLR